VSLGNTDDLSRKGFDLIWGMVFRVTGDSITDKHDESLVMMRCHNTFREYPHISKFSTSISSTNSGVGSHVFRHRFPSANAAAADEQNCI